jgi:hypothetical protein
MKIGRLGVQVPSSALFPQLSGVAVVISNGRAHALPMLFVRLRAERGFQCGGDSRVTDLATELHVLGHRRRRVPESPGGAFPTRSGSSSGSSCCHRGRPLTVALGRRTASAVRPPPR